MKFKPGPETKPFLEDPESPSSVPNPFQFKKNEYYASKKPVKKEKTWSQFFKDQFQGHNILHALIFCFLILHVVQIRSLQYKIFKLEHELYEMQSLKELDNQSQELLKKEEKGIQEIIKSFIPPTKRPSQIRSNTNQSSTFNAASLILGASLEKELSSQSVPPGDGFLDKISFLLESDQSEYVLLDRHSIPAKKAWCSDSKEPVLTVNLAEAIKPTGVSYQHTGWNGTLPNDAPKRYDVVACLNDNCTVTEPLSSNCMYLNSTQQPEQLCSVSTSLPTVNKVQFRFQENQGNPNKTCVYLVRVYGEPTEPLEEIQEENPVSLKKFRSELCTRLAWYHQSIRIIYNGLASKNCTTLYTNECCDECPECCTECQINDRSFWNYVQFCFIFFFLIFVLFPFYVFIISACCFCIRRYF